MTLPAAENTTALKRGARPVCRHCGAPLIDSQMERTGFCCAGCAYVFRLVNEAGLSSYYTIKDAVTTPADAAVFQVRDYSWLDTAQREAEAAAPEGRNPELSLEIQGISCAGCVWLIERVFQQQPGAREATVNAQYGTLRLKFSPGAFSAVEFARKLQALSYLVGPPGDEPRQSEARGLVRRIGLCGAFTLNVMLFSLPSYFGMEKSFPYASLFSLLSLGFATLAFLIGGSYFINRALGALREGVLHIDLPIALGIVGSYLGSLAGWLTGDDRFVYFDFVTTFTFLMLVGRWAQVSAVERNRRRLLSRQPKPRKVRALEADGSVREITPEKLATGQAYLAGSGQTVPVESRLEGGAADFSLASINGEAEPRTFRPGQRVPSGATSLARQDVSLVALQPWAQSLLAQLLAPAPQAHFRQLFIERITRWYLATTIVVAFLAGAGWWWVSADLHRVWSVVTSVLVVSCPCAIGLAFPLADEMATAGARRLGVFVRDNDVWSKLGRVRRLVFDKTGTLTLETPVLQNPEVLSQLGGQEREALLALVRDNPHPVSQCLCEQLLAAGAQNVLTGEVRETVGFGVAVTGPDGTRWSLGRPQWIPGSDAPLTPPSDGIEGSRAEFRRNAAIVATFLFRDTARPDAKQELAALARRGLPSYVLSGDRSGSVAALAADLGLDSRQVHGELTPQEKADWLAKLDNADALMLGDGANDSLAFDKALCRGTPVIHRGILEQKADFYYLGRGIGGLRGLLEINSVRHRAQTAILVFSIAYNGAVVALAALGRVSPLSAAILMPTSSLATLAILGWWMRPVLTRRAGA